ncbi:hypothetical protein [Brucella sp. IR073]|uniref:hypothetical protein n=1 Tax=unclassified Brucella TaxID=2632610 RepID=UPI003B9810AD
MAYWQVPIFLVVLSVVSGCVSPEERAMRREQRRLEQLQQDRMQCASYGFRTNTPDFANCMMNMGNQREMRKLERQRQREFNEAIEGLVGMQGQSDTDRIKELAILRSGDERFPICNATSENAGLDVQAHGWYGKNCRMK